MLKFGKFLKVLILLINQFTPLGFCPLRNYFAA